MSFALISGCSDVLKETPMDFNDPADYYNNDNSLLTGVNGVYSTLTVANYYGVNYQFAGEAFAETGATTNGTAFNALTNPRGSNPLIGSPDNMTSRIWNSLYSTVNQANAFVGRATDAEGVIDPLLRQRVIGEARFIRALTYFNLVRCWGAIPLRKERTFDFTSPNIAASPVKDVFGFIIEDLQFAIDNCWNKGETRGAYTNDVGRVTVLAAQSLLAKVYLEMASSSRYATPYKNSEYYQAFDLPAEDYYNLALEYCNDAIANPDFGWVGDWATIWSPDNQNSAEMIFAVQFAPQVSNGSSFFETYTPKESLFNKTSLNKGAFAIANPFLKRYSAAPWKINAATDYRYQKGMMLTFAVKTLPSVPITWSDAQLKYVNPDPSPSAWGVSTTDSPGALRVAKWIDESANLDNSSALDWPVIRAAELYLMRAEIKAELSPDVTVAFDDFNMVRARGNAAGLLDAAEMASYGAVANALGTTPLDEFHEAILRERLMEFMLEGYRWFDLKRLGVLYEVTRRMQGINASSLNRIRDMAWDYYWPYPQDELDGNSLMTQKTGY